MCSRMCIFPSAKYEIALHRFEDDLIEVRVNIMMAILNSLTQVSV